MADGMARSPSRLCSRDGKICCYEDALSTIFLLACFRALLPTFRFSFFFLFLIFFPCNPGMFIFFVSLRLCSSHLLLSASTYLLYVFFLLVCVICTLPHVGILLFFIRLLTVVYIFSLLLFLGWRFLCCALVPSTLALDLLSLIL